MFSDVMTDLETLGTTPRAVVISLGAVFFDVNTRTFGPTFEMVLDTGEQIKRGREVNPDTLKWWMQQDAAAKKVFHEKAKPVAEVLKTFSQWYLLNNPNRAFVWGNGATFDISILEDLYREYDLECPWGYNKAMDVRTFKRFSRQGAQIKKSGVNHRALDDALSQAAFVMGVDLP